MTRLEEIILEHIRLAKEYIESPFNGGNTIEEAAIINKRKEEIKQRILELSKERTQILNDGRV